MREKAKEENNRISLPYKIPLGFIDHRLIVHHVCVVAKGVVREQFLILNYLLCEAMKQYVIQLKQKICKMR